MVGLVFLELLVLKFLFFLVLRIFIFHSPERNLFFLNNLVELESPHKVKKFKTIGFPHWFESLLPLF